MKRTPRIPETEWETTKVVCAEAPGSASRSIELPPRTDTTWHPKTAKAFLNRPMKKAGRAYLYGPLVREDDCVSCADAGPRCRYPTPAGGSVQDARVHAACRPFGPRSCENRTP